MRQLGPEICPVCKEPVEDGIPCLCEQADAEQAAVDQAAAANWARTMSEHMLPD